MSVQREHREPGASAGEPAGGRGPNLHTAIMPPAGRRILLTTLLKPRKWSTFPKNAQILPAIFAVSEERRFHPRAAANRAPCSKSESSPAIFDAYIPSIPDLHTAHDPCTGCRDYDPRVRKCRACAVNFKTRTKR